MALSVKAYLYRNTRHLSDTTDTEPEIRRFGVDEGAATNYSYLERKVASIFPNLVGHVLRLHWQDVDGDFVAFSSDEELLDAVSCLDDPVFKIYVASYDGSRTSEGDQPDSAEQADAQALHPGVTCDGCQGPVRGYRYKCMECLDYDLCRECESAGKHPEHAMIRIVKPMQMGGCGFGFPPFTFGFGRGRGRHCPGGRGGHRHHRGGHCPPHHHHHHHHHQGAAEEGPQPGESSAETGEHQEETQAEQFLRTVGNAVAYMLDDFGIDVHVDVENNGQRRHCEPCSAPDSMDTEDDKPSQGAETAPQTDSVQEPPAATSQNAPPTSQDAPPAPVDTEPTATNTAEAPVTMDQTQPKTINQSDEGTNSIGPQNATTSTNAPMRADYRVLSPDGWTMVYPSLYPNPQAPVPQYPMQQAPFQPVRPVVQDPYERGLAPHVIHALNQMKSMGFTNDGGWLSALLAAKNGDIDSTLESLKPNITGPTA